MRFTVDDTLVRADPEGPVIRRQIGAGNAANQRLGAHAVLNQVGDGDHQQLVPLGKLLQLRHTRHRPVVVHDFADDAGGIQSGDAREIDGRFGLTGAHEHAAGARLQRKHVARPGEIARSCRRIDGRQHRGRAVARRDPRAGDVLGLHRHAEGGIEARGILRHHLRDLELREPVLRHRHADQAAAVLRHEVDG